MLSLFVRILHFSYEPNLFTPSLKFQGLDWLLTRLRLSAYFIPVCKIVYICTSYCFTSFWVDSKEHWTKSWHGFVRWKKKTIKLRSFRVQIVPIFYERNCLLRIFSLIGKTASCYHILLKCSLHRLDWIFFKFFNFFMHLDSNFCVINLFFIFTVLSGHHILQYC